MSEGEQDEPLSAALRHMGVGEKKRIVEVLCWWRESPGLVMAFWERGRKNEVRKGEWKPSVKTLERKLSTNTKNERARR